MHTHVIRLCSLYLVAALLPVAPHAIAMDGASLSPVIADAMAQASSPEAIS
jgi:hypothetical protein